MRLIRNHIVTPLDSENKEYLLINTLYGMADVISEAEYMVFKEWSMLTEIEPGSTFEKRFYEELKSHYFLVDNDKAENQIKEQMLMKCREQHIAHREDKSIAVFVLTYGCNFSCPYCYEAAPQHNSEKMSREMVDRVFDIHGSQLKKIGLFGGEPFLPSNREIIQYIISKGKDCSFFAITNGYYLNEYISELKQVHIDQIQITLDGTEEIHNQTRTLKSGQHTFSRIYENIRLCLQNSIPLRIRMNISADNLESCIRLRKDMRNEFSQYEELLKFELQPLFQIAQEEERAYIENEIYFKGLSDYGALNDDALSDNMIRKSFPQLLKLIAGDTKKLKPKYCFCDDEGLMFFYDPYGLVYSCILSVSNKNMAIGRYYPEIEYKEKSLFTRTIETVPKCKECSAALICGGGCGYSVAGQMGNADSPNCSTLVKLLKQDIPAFYQALNTFSKTKEL